MTFSGRGGCTKNAKSLVLVALTTSVLGVIIVFLGGVKHPLSTRVNAWPQADHQAHHNWPWQSPGASGGPVHTFKTDCHMQQLGRYEKQLNQDKVWCVEFEYSPNVPAVKLRAFVGGSGIATDDDIYRPGKRKLLNGSTMWWHMALPAPPHPNAMLASAIFAFGPYLGAALVAPLPVSPNLAASLASGLDTLPSIQVLNVNVNLLEPALHPHPRTADPHVALFGGGWDSSLVSLMAPGGHLFHETWVRSEDAIPSFTDKEMPLVFGDVRLAWEKLEGRSVVPVFTNSKYITSTFGWPSRETMNAGVILYASSHRLWGITSGLTVDAIMLLNGGDAAAPGRLSAENLPSPDASPLTSGPYFSRLYASAGMYMVNFLGGLPTRLIARLWVREAMRTDRLYRLGLPIVCDQASGAECFTPPCSKCVRKELINIAAALEEGLEPAETVNHLYRHPRTPWANRWKDGGKYFEPQPPTIGTTAMRAAFAVTLEKYLQQHGPNPLLPPLELVARIAWPPAQEQTWQNVVIEPAFLATCGHPSLCADATAWLQAAGAEFVGWDSPELEQLKGWNVTKYYLDHQTDIASHAAAVIATERGGR